MWTSTSSLGGSGQTSIANETIDDRVAALIQGGSELMSFTTTLQTLSPYQLIQRHTHRANRARDSRARNTNSSTHLPDGNNNGTSCVATSRRRRVFTTVTVSGGSSPTFQWQKLNTASTLFEDLSATSNITGVTTATLAYAATAEADNQTQLRCVVTDGDDILISSVMTLEWVSTTTPVPPLVVTFAADSLSSPNEISVTEDSNGNYDVSSALSVTATGGVKTTGISGKLLMSAALRVQALAEERSGKTSLELLRRL